MDWQKSFDALYQVARAVNASLEPEEVLQTIVDQTARALDAKASGIRILDRRGRRLIHGSSCGLSSGYIRKGPVNLADSGLDREVMTGQVVYIPDVQSDPRFQYPERAAEEGFHSVLVAPLMSQGRAVGVIRVYADRVREFGPEDIRFLEAAAELSAIALDRARLHQALKRDYELVLAHQSRLDDN